MNLRRTAAVTLVSTLAMFSAADAAMAQEPAITTPEERVEIIANSLRAAGASDAAIEVYVDARLELIDSRVAVLDELQIIDAESVEALRAAREDGTIDAYVAERLELRQDQWTDRRERAVAEVEDARMAILEEAADTRLRIEANLEERAALIEAGDLDGILADRVANAEERDADRTDRVDDRTTTRDDRTTSRIEDRTEDFRERQDLRETQRDSIFGDDEDAS